MKLWKLEGREDLPREKNPWCDYDIVLAGIVRAETEEAARNLMAKHGGEECEILPVDTLTLVTPFQKTYYKYRNNANIKYINPWLSSEYSNCTEISVEGKEEVILRDFICT